MNTLRAQLARLDSTLAQFRLLREHLGPTPGAHTCIVDLLEPRFPDDTLADRLERGAVQWDQVEACFRRAA